MKYAALLLLVLLLVAPAGADEVQPKRPYVVTDAGQTKATDTKGATIDVGPEHPLYGQDAHVVTVPMRFLDNGDDTITDLETGLMWQRAPAGKKLSWAEAMKHAKALVHAGHDDWRLPTIKELTSIATFDGSARTRTPYLDTRYFAFQFGDKTGERVIDSQYWSSTRYLGKTMFSDEAAFGFNFADAHIKAYPTSRPGGGRPGGGPGGRPGPPPHGGPPPGGGPGGGPDGTPGGRPDGGPGRSHGPGRDGKASFVLCVRSNADYGKNDYVDHGDGTITDRATGLMWTQADSGRAMNWPGALRYAKTCRVAGHADWRLPDAKELISIVDYDRAPDAPKASQRGPAIDPVFEMTDENAWYWTGTSHGDHLANAIYVCFGRGTSVMTKPDGSQVDAHGAGALRSDPKVGDPDQWAEGMGPQRDEVRILNYVRCVRIPSRPGKR